MLEGQTATSDILRAIAASPGDAEGSLRKIAETTARLFGAAGVSFRIAEGEAFKWSVGVGQGAEQITTSLYDDPALRPTVGGRNLPGTVVRENRQVHLPDLDHLDDEFADWPGPPVARRAGIRTMVGTPLRTKGSAIGALAVYRNVPQPFEPAELQLLQSFADQAVIAIENARLLTELRESLAQQTATADVLGVINVSGGDLQPVFEVMVEKARRLCEADAGHLVLPVGDDYRSVAVSAMSTEMTELIQSISYAPGRGTAIGRALAERRPVQISDIGADNEHAGREAAHKGFIRTILSVPLLRGGEAIGAFGLSRQRVEPFTEKQIELVKNFAAQAVIAIENARLLTELRETLEQQTATADVLRVISSSPGDLAPVFASILDNATRICQARFGSLFLRQGEALRVAAHHGSLTKAWDEQWRVGTVLEPDTGLQAFQTVAGRQPIQVLDLSTAPAYLAGQSQSGQLGRGRRHSDDAHRADAQGRRGDRRHHGLSHRSSRIHRQANCACDELCRASRHRHREHPALKRVARVAGEQTATADVLSVISSSPGDLQPVFNAMLENGARLCEAQFGNLLLREGEMLRISAMYNMTPEFTERFQREPVFRPGPLAPITRALTNKEFVHVVDLRQDAAYKERDPPVVSVVDEGGARSMIVVPMLKEGEAIGALSIFRQAVRPFTDKQIALVTSFASQAVIAIENARLLTALRERTDELGQLVEELRALGEISQAVNSTLDLQNRSPDHRCQGGAAFRHGSRSNLRVRRDAARVSVARHLWHGTGVDRGAVAAAHWAWTRPSLPRCWRSASHCKSPICARKPRIRSTRSRCAPATAHE